MGHVFCLVSSEDDRIRRLTGRVKFYDLHGYSQIDREKIPTYHYLTNPPTESQVDDRRW